MSQLGAGELSDYFDQFGVFDMPFLFRDHDHVARVLDGEIGQDLKDNFVKGSNSIRPLAFTYSGGFRVFVADKPVFKAEHLKSLQTHAFYKFYENLPKPKYENDHSVVPPSVRQSTYNALGIKTVVAMNEPESKVHMARLGLASLTEDHYSHYTRIFFKFGLAPSKMGHIWESNHSLFLTSIVVNEVFYQSLPDDLKSILNEETQKLALIEREDAIETDKKAKGWLEASGFKIYPMTPAERDKLKKLTEPVYAEHSERIGKTIIDRIKKLENKAKELASTK